MSSRQMVPGSAEMHCAWSGYRERGPTKPLACRHHVTARLRGESGASEDGTGIRGGVGGGPGYQSHAVFYIGVPDVEAALQRAEELGGTRVMGPATSPIGLVVGHFTDPEGTLIGVAGVA